jgi:hypothetical protein
MNEAVIYHRNGILSLYIKYLPDKYICKSSHISCFTMTIVIFLETPKG